MICCKMLCMYFFVFIKKIRGRLNKFLTRVMVMCLGFFIILVEVRVYFYVFVDIYVYVYIYTVGNNFILVLLYDIVSWVLVLCFVLC